MTRASIEQDAWTGTAEARRHFATVGLDHILELDVPAVDNTAHWHRFDSCFYLTSGELQLTDVASGEVLHCRAGTRVTVPARVLHAEYSPEGYGIFLGTSVPAEAFGDPVNRPPDEL